MHLGSGFCKVPHNRPHLSEGKCEEHHQVRQHVQRLHREVAVVRKSEVAAAGRRPEGGGLRADARREEASAYLLGGGKKTAVGAFFPQEKKCATDALTAFRAETKATPEARPKLQPATSGI